MKNENERKLLYALISLLKINKHNYRNEIRSRLEMMGITFPDSKKFDEFKKSKVRIVESNEMKVAWLNQGADDEMLLAWWN